MPFNTIGNVTECWKERYIHNSVKVEIGRQ